MNALATIERRRCGTCGHWCPTGRARGKRVGSCTGPIPALPASVNPISRSEVTEDFGKTCSVWHPTTVSDESFR